MSRKYQYVIWHHDQPLDLCTSRAELDACLLALEARVGAGRLDLDALDIEQLPWNTIPDGDH